MNSNPHSLLERATSCQDLYVNNEDVTGATCPLGISFFRLYTRGCDRRSNAHSISGFTISVGLLYLVSDTLLRSLVKVIEVCGCQIFLLGYFGAVLPVCVTRVLPDGILEMLRSPVSFEIKCTNEKGSLKASQ